jgi:hypothetical protein
VKVWKRLGAWRLMADCWSGTPLAVSDRAAYCGREFIRESKLALALRRGWRVRSVVNEPADGGNGGD